MTLSNDPIQAFYDERARLNPPMKWIQRAVTALPDPAEPMPRTGPVRMLLADLSLLVASAAGAGVLAQAATSGGVATLGLIPAMYASLTAVGVLRKLTVGHKHEAGHGVGFAGWRAAGASRRTVRAIRFTLMETSAVVALAGNGVQYMREHHRHHALRHLGTARDPDGARLLALGFRRGLAKGEFGRRLLGLLANPLWYGREAAGRLVHTTTQGPWIGRVASIFGWAGLAGSALVLPAPAWIFTIGFPWLIGFPAASLLQVITEHPYVDPVGATDLPSYIKRTWDRVPWQATPSSLSLTPASLGAWASWWVKFLLVHLPTRLAIYDRTMIWHRYHHIAWPLGRPFDEWWAIHHHVVRAWRDGALPDGWEANLLEGLPAALARQQQFMESTND